MSLNWAMILYRVGIAISWLIFIGLTAWAASWVGYLFGWVMGGSNSPIGAVVAPIIFGLLAVLGIAKGARAPQLVTATLERLPTFRDLDIAKKASIKTELASEQDHFRYSRLAIAAAGVVIFCMYCHWGLHDGIQDRTSPYPMMSDLVFGWKNLDAKTVDQLYDIRWRLQKSGMRGKEFMTYVADVIAPVLNSDKLQTDEKAARLSEIADSLPE